MNMKQLRAILASANLSQLARLTRINIRTLRRIKSGETRDVKLSTLNAIEKGATKQ
jgi:DNA-binding Xre family transcriptional regulator